MWRLTYRWASCTHPNKPKRWIVNRYFGQFNPTRQDRWVFGDRDSGAYQVKFAWTTIVRHPLVKGAASPDDPALARYWADRRRKKTPPPLDKRGAAAAPSPARPLPGMRGLPAPRRPRAQSPREWEQWLALTRKAIYHQWITPQATRIATTDASPATVSCTPAACHATTPSRQPNGDSAPPASPRGLLEPCAGPTGMHGS